jgi:hypothetical protein
MDRRTFVGLTGSALVVALLTLAGCGPKGLSAAVAKQECFANQAKIRDMFDLFYADSGEYPPIGIVVQKLGITCPSGGTYTFDAKTVAVSCSVHGHG